MTDDQLRAIRERSERATMGPWRVEHVRLAVRLDGTNVHPFASQIQVSDSWPLCQFLDHRDGTLQDPGPAPNAAFIAASRTDVPALLEEAERLKDENTALRATLASVQRQLEGQCREVCGPEFRERDLHSGACLHYIADEIGGTVAALAGDVEKGVGDGGG